ncbi:MAG TPA: 23S rRNA (pseudouridine(1915)-N(3))-methyltransferase RlmH [Candidatus Onthovivens sp.]|nr:23S rRNA (pseudouridine(1915)-N(3))-methyltransferase RlmH [Candidatus Onthovivens sp.]
MIKLKILAIGKIKEDFNKMAIKEYLKRLSKFASVEIIELEEEKIQNKSVEDILEVEGNAILNKLANNDYLILLDLHGKEISSEEFALNLQELENKGTSPVFFAIGGTLGVSESLRKRANFRLSISQMTFTHQVTRVLLLEQIYRAFKINRNEKYHH